MKRRKRPGRARRANTLINFYIKKLYEDLPQEASKTPRIISDIIIDPPLPTSVIEAIKQRPVKVINRDRLPAKNSCIEYNCLDSTVLDEQPDVEIIFEAPPSVEFIAEYTL